MKKLAILMLTVALMACANKQARLENECLYSSRNTQFAFWSNIAEQMEVRLYDDAQTTTFEAVPLTKGDDDFWRAKVCGDLAGAGAQRAVRRRVRGTRRVQTSLPAGRHAGDAGQGADHGHAPERTGRQHEESQGGGMR